MSHFVSSLLYLKSIVYVVVIQLCLTLCDPWTVAHQAPVSMELFRQDCWSGLPFPSPEDLPSSGIKPRSPALKAEALPSEPPVVITILLYELGSMLTPNFSEIVITVRIFDWS